MKKILTLISFLLFSYALSKAQKTTPMVMPGDTIPAVIDFKKEQGGLRFTSSLRPLRGIAGAPEPFYTYFWEFGDGKFSFEKEPLHQFPDSLIYNVRLFATNSYDDGKRPPTRPKPIKPGTSRPVLASLPGTGSSFFKSDGAIEMKTNCMPKPGDEMMLVLGYKNKVNSGVESLNGTLSILYNDKEFAKDNFELLDSRVYNGEKKVVFNNPSNLAAMKFSGANDPYYSSVSGPSATDYGNASIDEEATAILKEQTDGFKTGASWKFENLKRGEEKFIFLQFKTTPEMIRDTNAVLRLNAVFVPESPFVPAEFFTLELQIVASHDPNKMMLKNSRMNFRLIGKKKKLSYKVRFQNTGKGPAKKVDVGVMIADVLDPSSVKIIDSKPKLALCAAAYSGQSCLDTLSIRDSLHFVFRNIYLPGLQQEDVTDGDSTMGFIEYQIGFKDKPKKLPFNSGAAIVFDRNEPIYTNRSTGKYKMGLSPGLIAGWGFPLEQGNTPYTGQKTISFGLSISPFAPHRYFLQAELYANHYSEKSYLIKRTDGAGKIVAIDGGNGRKEEFRVNYIDSIAKTKVITLNLVPVQLRRNFNKFIGAGIGTMVSIDLDAEHIPSSEALLESIQSPGTLTNVKKVYEKVEDSFSNFQNTMFADVQIGKVHTGPALGFRYLFTIQNSANRMITYLTWKF